MDAGNKLHTRVPGALKSSFPLLLAFVLFLSNPSKALLPASQPVAPLSFTTNGGFCPNGAPHEVLYEASNPADHVGSWGTSCDYQLADRTIESAPFLAPDSLSFALAGYIGRPGLRLYLRNVAIRQEMELRPAEIPGESWRHETFDVPEQWRGQPIQIVGEAHVTSKSDWFAFTPPELPSSAWAATGEISTDGPEHGFCSDDNLPTGLKTGRPAGLSLWRSFCDKGDQNTGWMASAPFIAGRAAAFYVAGYPGSPGLRLAIQEVDTGLQLPLTVPSLPRESWRLFYFPLPRQWEGHRVRLLAEDKATSGGGWLAFAGPVNPASRTTFAALRLLALLLGLLIVSWLPAIAACMLAARSGVRATLTLTTVGLLTLGAVGYAAFWVYFLNRRAGTTFSFMVLLASVGVVSWCLAAAERRARLIALQPFILPLLFTAMACFFVVCLASLYAKPQMIQPWAGQRFGPPPLSIDNVIPKIFADEIYQGHVPKPSFGDWLSSDRPPLQAGVVLWHYAWTHGTRDLPYQLLGTILQLTCVLALWAYLDAAGIGRRPTALILATVLFSGFTIFNAFFVWPKLLSATYLLIVTGYLFTDSAVPAGSRWTSGAMVGAAVAFAMLSHGGAAFGLIGIAITLAVLRRWPGWRFIVAAGATAFILYLPWMLYQKYYDPPGDRLVKMHLAGVLEPHPNISFHDLVVTQYKAAGWSGVAHNKADNFRVLLDTYPFWEHPARLLGPLFIGGPVRRAAAVEALRYIIFNYWAWSLDLFAIAFLLWVFCFDVHRRMSPEYRQARILCLFTVSTLIPWCLLMFGPATTVVYQGCYLTELMTFAAGIMSLWLLNRFVAIAAAAFHIIFSLAIYGFFRTPRLVGMGTYAGPVQPAFAVATCVSFAAAILILWRMQSAVTRREPSPVVVDARAAKGNVESRDGVPDRRA